MTPQDTAGPSDGQYKKRVTWDPNDIERIQMRPGGDPLRWYPGQWYPRQSIVRAALVAAVPSGRGGRAVPVLVEGAGAW